MDIFTTLSGFVISMWQALSQQWGPQQPPPPHIVLRSVGHVQRLSSEFGERSSRIRRATISKREGAARDSTGTSPPPSTKWNLRVVVAWYATDSVVCGQEVRSIRRR